MRDNKVKKTVKNCEKVFAVNGRNLKEAENEYTTGGSRGKAAAMGRDSSPAFRRFQWPRSIQEVKRIDQEQFKALMEMEAPSTRYASTAIADPQTGKTMLPIWDEVLTNFYRVMEWDEDTGKPLPKKLRELDLEYVIPDLWAEEKAAEMGCDMIIELKVNTHMKRHDFGRVEAPEGMTVMECVQHMIKCHPDIKLPAHYSDVVKENDKVIITPQIMDG